MGDGLSLVAIRRASRQIVPSAAGRVRRRVRRVTEFETPLGPKLAQRLPKPRLDRRKVSRGAEIRTRDL